MKPSFTTCSICWSQEGSRIGNGTGRVKIDLGSLKICESCARGSYEIIDNNKFSTHASNNIRVGDIENPVKFLRADILQMEKDERTSYRSPSGCFLLYKNAKSIGTTAQKKVWDLSKKIVFGNKRPPVVYLAHWQTNFPVISRKREQEVEKFDVCLKLVKRSVGLTDDDDVDFKGDDDESECASDHGNSSESGSSSSSSSSSSDGDD